MLRVSLHAPMYFGRPEWPPSPGRLFQALVAGAAHRLADPDVLAAFRWLERQPAPYVAVPTCVEGQAVTLYVPNNDLDTKGGDPANVPTIRTAKDVRARHLRHAELLFAWPIEADEETDEETNEETEASAVIQLASDLYQLGRGVDMASARGEIVDQSELREILAAWRGERTGDVHYPTPGLAGDRLGCPQVGTLDSLMRRHRAFGERFQLEGRGRSAKEVFALPPKGLFRSVAYDSKARRVVFELRHPDDLGRFAPFAAAEVVAQMTQWRDAAALRLTGAGLPVERVHGVLVGRRPAEPERVPLSARARLIPLPSVGHDHADERVRRILVELPSGGPVHFEDLRWALSGLQVGGRTLVEAEDRVVSERFLGRSTTWRTVTPMAIPAHRGPSNSSAGAGEAKGAAGREQEDRAAIRAVRQALRHAGVDTPDRAIDVQREPFTPNGSRAEQFQHLPRFRASGLWHVRVEFVHPVAGPMVLGDGRFLGLGVMQPSRGAAVPVIAWTIRQGLQGAMRPNELARHLRRAVLARAQRAWGRKPLPPFVSGHLADGSPAQDHRHLHYLIDPVESRLLVWQPHPNERLVGALRELTELRAGDMGVLDVQMTPLGDADRLIAAGTRWRSVTPYRVQRHRKAATAAGVVELDVRASCQQWPLRDVHVNSVQSVRGGIEAHIELHFERPVAGPLVLGKTRHLGGGLFECVQS